MVQIGNYHIGKAETAKESVLSAGKAHVLWNQLVARYDCIEKTQIYHYFIHDLDFKAFLGKGLTCILEKQVDELEAAMDSFKLPLPPRPPKSVNVDGSSQVMNDRYIFRDIFASCENLLSTLLHTVRTYITNDPMRKLFIRHLQQEIEAYDDLCKYGRVKGWFEVPPAF
ncbi:MAG: DUF3231 family protein [Bacillota bacterium]